MKVRRIPFFNFVLVAVVLGFPYFAFAQTADSMGFTLKGRVTSQGESLFMAHVYVPALQVGTTTNEQGTFELTNLPLGTHTVNISSLGYQSLNKDVIIKNNQENVLNVALLPDQGSLEQIVITGTLKPVRKADSPVPIEVYGKSFFKANPTPSVFESMAHINGVRPQLNCNVCDTGDIRINGLEGPYTFVLIDGLPIVSGLSTVYGLNGIPQSLIERVEIVKGPASTLYGSEAIGGVINVITKKPDNAPLIAADNFTTSWGETTTDLGTKYKLAKKVDGLLGINYHNFQNEIDNNGDGFTDLTLQNRISIFNKMNIQRANNKVFTVAGRYVYEDRWGGQLGFNTANRGGDQVYGESIYTSRWEVFGNYDLPTTENLSLQFSGNGHDQNSFYGETAYNATQYIGFGQLLWNKQVHPRHDLLLGAAYRYTFYDDNTFATLDTNGINNQPAITHLPGIFVQDEMLLKERQSLLLGVRYDYNSLHGSVLSPRANYKWTSLDKSNTLRVSAGNGFRVANIFTEDHAALTGAREVVFEGTLQPETSWNTNVNYVKNIITKNNTFINLDATAFYTYFTNRILPDYETNPNQIIYANLDGFSVSQGISLNADITFPSGPKVLAGATVMDVSVTENGQRRRQILTEGYSGVWTISYTIQPWGLNIDYTGNVYGPMRLPLLGDSDPRAPFSPVYSIQNIQFSKTINTKWQLYGGVKNLLNFTPSANSIARAFDPFDRGVTFDNNGQAVATPNNPNALTFDPSYVFASNQGIRGFVGLRYTVF